jgi:hypothetical protein
MLLMDLTRVHDKPPTHTPRSIEKSLYLLGSRFLTLHQGVNICTLLLTHFLHIEHLFGCRGCVLSVSLTGMI